MTLTEIIVDLRTQLAWRGPTGRPLGHVVLERVDAVRLLEALRVLSSDLPETPKGNETVLPK